MEPYHLLTYVQELKQRLEVLARENAKLRVERDIARSQVLALIPKATPEQEAEFRRQLESEKWVDGFELQRIVEELERKHRQ